MTNKVININLSARGVNKAIKEFKAYRDKIERGIPKLLERLVEEGVSIGQVKFLNAQYDGDNDVAVYSRPSGDGAYAVIAMGSATLFIEFGTGITYPDNHPLAAENGMVRGEYGKGMGKRRSWEYYGNPGSNGEIRMTRSGEEIVRTQGNPANMSMYDTVKELQSKLPQIVKEVFG